MKCELCNDVEFETFLRALQHYRKVHKISGYLMCCGVKFNKRSRMLDHIRYHQSSQKDPEVLRKFEKEKEDAQIREFFTMKCELCSDVEFETLLRATQHYRKVHKVRGYLKCCGSKCFRRCQILEHIRYHTDPDGFRCKQCGKICKNKYSLKRHISHHAPLSSRVHKCSLCPSSFALRGLLNSHIKQNHSAKNGETFPCDKCGKE